MYLYKWKRCHIREHYVYIWKNEGTVLLYERNTMESSLERFQDRKKHKVHLINQKMDDLTGEPLCVIVKFKLKA